jgi:hypothetical protein
MAKSAGYWVNDHDRRVRGLGEAWVVVKRRLVEALGFALLLVCLLLILTLLTYDARDGSLNTAVDSTPRNFLGHDGAVLADLLWQSLGLASFLIPILLLAWSFRLLFNRLIRSIGPTGAASFDPGVGGPRAGSRSGFSHRRTGGALDGGCSDFGTMRARPRRCRSRWRRQLWSV